MTSNSENEDFDKNQENEDQSDGFNFDFDKVKMDFTVLDYYKLLGVNKNATTDQIRKAYRQKSKLFHSDKTKGDDELMIILNNVKMTLIDPDKRAEYDQNYDSDDCDKSEWNKFLNSGPKESQSYKDDIDKWIKEFDSLKFEDNSQLIMTKISEIKQSFEVICNEDRFSKKTKLQKFLDKEERLKVSLEDRFKQCHDILSFFTSI